MRQRWIAILLKTKRKVKYLPISAFDPSNKFHWLAASSFYFTQFLTDQIRESLSLSELWCWITQSDVWANIQPRLLFLPNLVCTFPFVLEWRVHNSNKKESFKIPCIKRECSSVTKKNLDVSFCLDNRANTQRSDLNNL